MSYKNEELINDFIDAFQQPLFEFLAVRDEEEIKIIQEKITERFSDGKYDLLYDVNMIADDMNFLEETA
jgi:hypothetical protein